MTPSLRGVAALSVALLLGGQCGAAAAKAKRQRPEVKKEATKMTSEKPVEITITRVREGRPPQLRMELDVVLRNGEAEPRWFLLPRNLPAPQSLKTGGVDAVETYALGEQQVVLGRFLGTGGFQGVLLPPGASVNIKGVELNHFGDPPAKLSLEVRIAKDVKLGAEAAQAWLKPAEGKGAPGTRLLGVRRAPDNKEIPVQVIGEQRVTLELPVPEIS